MTNIHLNNNINNIYFDGNSMILRIISNTNYTYKYRTSLCL